MAIKVLVTGAAGQIAYSLVFMIARGHMFGPNEKVILHLLDIPPMMKKLQGLGMELEDCCLPLLEAVVLTDDLKVAFSDIDVACMVGAMPRRAGMERSDLLKANVKIFVEQGKALSEYAKTSCKVVVVGNPANTNALVMQLNAPRIPARNFSALTRLDVNRCVGQLALRCKVPCSDVKNAIVWGNHSGTQFPDAFHAQVGSKPASEVLKDDTWLKNDFVKMIQTRGAAVIQARESSSAVSAAKAITDHIRDWWCGTQPGHYASMAVLSQGEYDTPKDVMFSFPCTIDAATKEWKVVADLPLDDWAKEMLRKTGEELVAERDDALAFLKA